jgi:hypothetical protein
VPETMKRLRIGTIHGGFTMTVGQRREHLAS